MSNHVGFKGLLTLFHLGQMNFMPKFYLCRNVRQQGIAP